MPYRPRIKICGIRTVADACYAASLGVDAIGLVFYPPSPRHVELEQACRIVQALPPLVSVVALFVNPNAAEVARVITTLAVDLLQFHGDEDEAFCHSFARPYIKALPVRTGADVQAQLSAYGSARALLLDTYHPQLRGGTGDRFDWAQFPRAAQRPLILAGGLNPDNVGAAVAQLQPYAVDVSGGVESARGIKNQALMRAFVAGVGRGYED